MNCFLQVFIYFRVPRTGDLSFFSGFHDNTFLGDYDEPRTNKTVDLVQVEMSTRVNTFITIHLLKKNSYFRNQQNILIVNKTLKFHILTIKVNNLCQLSVN